MTKTPATPVIKAKHAVPPVRPGAVVRGRLHEPLLDPDTPRLTVVVAPAGWGKTTLLSQWAHDPAESRSVIWVSLDEADDDPIRFWTYILAALQDSTGGVGAIPLQALNTPGLDPVDFTLPTLLNELSALETEHVLVLDDYHLITDPRITEGMEFLLAYLPPTLRVVIAARSDPPLPLARLRAGGDLAELRAEDLGFSIDEAAALLSTVGEAPFDRRAATLLWERTEGWAAGLQLAALTVRGSSRPADAVMAIHGDDRHIVDYLSSEVVDRLLPEHRDLLLRTSVLERLCGPLCDHVLERDGSGDVLADLDRAHLFVVPLDQRREWYRCHRLFRDVLLRRLESSDSGEAARVHSRAAEWFVRRGLLDEAVDHLISAGEEATAAELLRSKVPSFLEEGALAAHLRLGQRLSAERVLADPQLCVSLAWAAGLSGQFARMGPWLDAAERLISDDTAPLEGWGSLRGAQLTMRAVHVSIVGADADAAVAMAFESVELETDPMLPGYVVARTILGAMLTFAARSREAVSVLEDAWDRARALGLPPLLALQAASILSMALAETDRVERLRHLLTEVAPDLRAAEARWGSTTSPGIARLRTVEGQLAHRDGDLDAARSLLRRAVHLARTFGEAPGLVDALTSLAEVELDGHDGKAAYAALSEARDVVDNDPVLPQSVLRLEEVERRAGRTAVRSAQQKGLLVEELTDRERAVLRALTGDATQREIGAELFLSINTVKGYTRVLYRKLGVECRRDAVREARALGLV